MLLRQVWSEKLVDVAGVHSVTAMWCLLSIQQMNQEWQVAPLVLFCRMLSGSLLICSFCRSVAVHTRNWPFVSTGCGYVRFNHSACNKINITTVECDMYERSLILAMNSWFHTRAGLECYSSYILIQYWKKVPSHGNQENPHYTFAPTICWHDWKDETNTRSSSTLTTITETGTTTSHT